MHLQNHYCVPLGIICFDIHNHRYVTEFWHSQAYEQLVLELSSPIYYQTVTSAFLSPDIRLKLFVHNHFEELSNPYCIEYVKIAGAKLYYWHLMLISTAYIWRNCCTVAFPDAAAVRPLSCRFNIWCINWSEIFSSTWYIVGYNTFCHLFASNRWMITLTSYMLIHVCGCRYGCWRSSWELWGTVTRG